MDAGHGQSYNKQDQHISILLEEYRVLYSTVLPFRLASLDRRAPIAGATLTAFLAATAIMPIHVQIALYLGIPLVLTWYLRSSATHAVSFADVLGRLVELERTVNENAGCQLLQFQSRHPSRGIAVGGRTGRETVMAVFTMCMLILAACVYFVWNAAVISLTFRYVYTAYAGIVAIYLVSHMIAFRRYRYQKQ